MSLCYQVDFCSLHGRTKQRRWYPVFRADTKAECVRWLEDYITKYAPVSEAVDPRSWHITPEWVLDRSRIRGVRV